MSKVTFSARDGGRNQEASQEGFHSNCGSLLYMHSVLGEIKGELMSPHRELITRPAGQGTLGTAKDRIPAPRAKTFPALHFHMASFSPSVFLRHGVRGEKKTTRASEQNRFSAKGREGRAA